MKKSILHRFILILAFFYSGNIFADRPSELENERYVPAAETQTESLSARPENTPTKTIQENKKVVLETHGDIVQIPANNVRHLDFPRRGTSQDKVQNELGRPLEIVPAVGKPPISQWIYNDRKVYFEYSSVIHVVAK